MSKLKERVPALVDTATKLALADETISRAAGPDGRIKVDNLVTEIENEIAKLDVNEGRLIEEGRKAAAQQVASAWMNTHRIQLNRNQRVATYQLRFGFAASYFKVGSELVPTEAMTIRDFEVMIDRQERRLENATGDLNIWRDFFERARPGLEEGQTLVQLYDSGALNEALASVNGDGQEIEGGDES